MEKSATDIEDISRRKTVKAGWPELDQAEDSFSISCKLKMVDGTLANGAWPRAEIAGLKQLTPALQASRTIPASAAPASVGPPASAALSVLVCGLPLSYICDCGVPYKGIVSGPRESGIGLPYIIIAIYVEGYLGVLAYLVTFERYL